VVGGCEYMKPFEALIGVGGNPAALSASR